MTTTAQPAPADFNMEAACATLDALVHGERRIVSFRLLSGVLRVPTTAAKAALRAYAQEHADALAVLWAVALGESPTFALATAAYPGPESLRGLPVRSKTVWAVARRDAAPPPGADELWAAEDRVREMDMAKRPATEVNELRDNRWSVFRSETARWTGGSDETPAGSANAGADVEKIDGGKKKTLSMLERIKVEDAEREKNRQNRAKSGVLSMFTTKPKDKSDSGSRPSSRQPLSLAKPKARLTLKKENPPSESKPSSRKVRRLVHDSDDEDSVDTKDKKEVEADKGKKSSDEPHGKEDDDDEELDSEAEALEQEAALQEEADRDRARLDAEAARKSAAPSTGLKRPSSESPAVEMEDDGEDVERDAHVDQPSVRSASADEALAEHCEGNDGDATAASPPTIDGEKESAPPAGSTAPVSMRSRGRLSNGSSKRSTCRIVEDTVVDEKGYIVTRRVTKYFDDDGNEIPDEPDLAAQNGDEAKEHAPSVAAEEEAVLSPPEPVADSRPEPLPASNKRANVAQSTATRKVNRKPKLENNGRSNSSGVIAKKSTKKPKGNIASYFCKK